jgi:hypothetical protein
MELLNFCSVRMEDYQEGNNKERGEDEVYKQNFQGSLVYESKFFSSDP